MVVVERKVQSQFGLPLNRRAFGYARGRQASPLLASAPSAARLFWPPRYLYSIVKEGHVNSRPRYRCPPSPCPRSGCPSALCCQRPFASC